MQAQLSYLSLIVADLAVSVRFYQALGWQLHQQQYDFAVFRLDNGVRLALLTALKARTLYRPLYKKNSNYSSILLSHNVADLALCSTILQRARLAGAQHIQEVQRADWGAWVAYFQDIDGYAWELTYQETAKIDSKGCII
jgi:uncharacterized protein